MPAIVRWSVIRFLIRSVRPPSSSAELVAGERERVGTEPGDPRDLLRVGHQVHRQALLRAGLGEVEPGPADGVEVHPELERPAPGLRWGGGGRLVPAQPAGPRQVGDQVQRLVGPVGELDGQELPVPGRSGDDATVECRHRRVEGLEHAHAGDVHPRDGPVEGVLAQVVGERLDLGGSSGSGTPHRAQFTGCRGLSAWPGVARVRRLRTSTRISSFALPRPRTMPVQCSAGRS